MSEYQKIYDAIIEGDEEIALQEAEALLAQNIPPIDIINKGLISAMDEIGRLYKEEEIFIPEMMMAAQAVTEVIDMLKPHMPSGSGSRGTIVIGTVQGDIHDIGKNLVASMLEGCGFEVINIGIDVTCDKFVEAVKENHADILCMSALLTTTMTYMKEVIQALEEAGIRNQVKVMIGGALVSQGFADEIGADGYSDNANTAVAVAKELIGNKK